MAGCFRQPLTPCKTLSASSQYEIRQVALLSNWDKIGAWILSAFVLWWSIPYRLIFFRVSCQYCQSPAIRTTIDATHLHMHTGTRMHTSLMHLILLSPICQSLFCISHPTVLPLLWIQKWKTGPDLSRSHLLTSSLHSNGSLVLLLVLA